MARSDLITLALEEDIGTGDVTAEFFTDDDRRSVATIVARRPAVLAGLDVATEVFRRVDENLSVTSVRSNGDRLDVGDDAMEILGATRSILTAERTALNFLQRLSGVATMTRSFVDAVEGTGCQILDTRKTTPGWRTLEKEAVLAGGGTNHRMGLYDMVMVKDNHLAGGLDLDALEAGIRNLHEVYPLLRVEVEADCLRQAVEFFGVPGVDVVLLDNMPVDQIREAVRLRPGHILLEASGGITLDTVRAVAETGVDFISVGALTHSAPSVDLSLEISADVQGD